MKDPLGNPREPWRLHYNPHSLAGRWGAFLCRTFRLKTSGERYLDELLAKYDR